MTSIYNVLAVFLYVVVTTEVVRSHQCVSPLPCTCSGKSVDCSNKHITTVPHMVGETNTSYSLQLSSNPNLVITDDTFTNITVEYLDLSNNINMSLSDHALKSQRYSLKELHMSNCKMARLPEALMDLDSLEILYIWSNHIQHWDEKLMFKLSGTLNIIDLSDTGLTYWPNWLSLMSNLKRLSLYNNSIDRIPHSAFYSAAATLTHLNIDRCGISDMPTAIASLHNLTELNVGGMTLDGSSFYDNWLPSHESKLKSLSINNTTITTIPYGLSGHSSIKTLTIVGSRLRHVDEEDMPPNVTALFIINGLLTRINAGVCSQDLTYLRLQSNQIERIEKHDLEDCKNLNYLDVDDNNIDYISPTAFDLLSNLHTLYLQNNWLVKIPWTIHSLSSLSALYLSGNPLVCSCQTVWFLKWRQQYRGVHVSGRCNVLGIDINQFHSHCSPTLIPIG